MYTTQDIITSFANDTRIIKHLAAKIPQDKLNRSPAEGTRTFKELLEYMVRMGVAPLHIALNGYNPEEMKAMRLQAEQEDAVAQFDALMDKQLETITQTLQNLDEATLNEEVEIFWNKQLRKQFILEIALKNFPAYRMQLFMYLKVGLKLSELNSANLRQGVDMQS